MIGGTTHGAGCTPALDEAADAELFSALVARRRPLGSASEFCLKKEL